MPPEVRWEFKKTLAVWWRLGYGNSAGYGFAPTIDVRNTRFGVGVMGVHTPTESKSTSKYQQRAWHAPTTHTSIFVQMIRHLVGSSTWLIHLRLLVVSSKLAVDPREKKQGSWKQNNETKRTREDTRKQRCWVNFGAKTYRVNNHITFGCELLLPPIHM